MNNISIIMAAYQAEVTISESIESVLAQTYESWELIIVNDASGDNTEKIAKLYADKDKRIRVFANEINLGAALTRNFGISQASGEFLAFLDSDDLWRKDKLAKQFEFMKDKNAVISFTGTSYINVKGKISNYVLQAKSEFTYKELLRGNIMSCSSVMVRRENMIEFPTGHLHEDYVVWLSILKKIKCAHGLNEPLLIYRLGEATKSSSRINSARMIFNAYRQIGYGRLLSSTYTLRYALHSLRKRAKIKNNRERKK